MSAEKLSALPLPSERVGLSSQEALKQAIASAQELSAAVEEAQRRKQAQRGEPQRSLSGNGVFSPAHPQPSPAAAASRVQPRQPSPPSMPAQLNGVHGSSPLPHLAQLPQTSRQPPVVINQLTVAAGQAAAAPSSLPTQTGPPAALMLGNPMQPPHPMFHAAFPMGRHMHPQVLVHAQHFYQPRNLHPMIQPNPPQPSSMSSSSAQLNMEAGALIASINAHVERFPGKEHQAQIVQQLRSAHAAITDALRRWEGGDKGAEADAQAKLKELKLFEQRIVTQLVLQSQQAALMGGIAVREVNGVAEKESKTKSRKDGAADSEARSGRKRRRKHEGETEEERRERKREQAREYNRKRKERKRRAQLGLSEEPQEKEGKDDKKKRKSSKKKKKKKRKKQRREEGEQANSAASSSSSSSSSSESDHDSLFRRAAATRPPGDTNGHAKESAEDGLPAPAVVLLTTEEGEEKRKKRRRKRKQKTSSEDPEPPSPAPAIVVPPEWRATFNIDDFAPAFQHFTAKPLTVPRRPALVGPKKKKQRLHPPDPADDDPAVVQKSALLSSHVFPQQSVVSLMQQVMPLNAAVSADAAALVTQALCQFIALITAEAEDGVHDLDEDEPQLPEQDAVMADASTPAAVEQKGGDGEISTEKMLDAMLRLGFEDYAILCARHVQRYRDQQPEEAAENAPLVQPMDASTAESSPPAPPALVVHASPPLAHRSAPPGSRTWLPATLTASYLMSNAQYIDMTRFSPSIPRHPITGGFHPYIPPFTRSSSKPSSSTHSPSSKSPSAKQASALLHAGDPGFDYSEWRGAIAKAAHKRKKELLASGLSSAEASEVLRKEREERKKQQAKDAHKQRKPRKQQPASTADSPMAAPVAPPQQPQPQSQPQPTESQQDESLPPVAAATAALTIAVVPPS